jgi:hypothetical protein
MTATTLSRAAQVAEIHGRAINASRKRCGLAPLTAAELAHEFADLDRSPPRAKVGSPRTNTGAADTMWGGIVARLNTTVRAKPIGLSSGRIASPAASPGNSSNRTVDWGEISRGLNEQAGLASPARSAR